jgi:uncharacterized glyoxalase superfamily protein PhnB
LVWLERAFGLKPFGDIFKGPDGKINHAAMKLLDGAVMMGCPGAGYQNPRKLGAVTQQLYVRITGVDRHFERAKSAGADIVEAPTDTFYGARRPRRSNVKFAVRALRMPADSLFSRVQ